MWMPLGGRWGAEAPRQLPAQPAQQQSHRGGCRDLLTSPSLLLPGPQGRHTLLPRSHLLGERRRRSSLEPRAGESRGAERKRWERQFSLIWANPLPAELSQNLTRKKNNSLPASRQLGAGFPQPVPHRHRET